MTVKNLIIKLLAEPMDTEVQLTIDDPHQDEHGDCSGYVFDIDSVTHEFGICMIKFTDYRSDKKQVCEAGENLIEWITMENRIMELEKRMTNISSTVSNLKKRRGNNNG